MGVWLLQVQKHVKSVNVGFVEMFSEVFLCKINCLAIKLKMV